MEHTLMQYLQSQAMSIEDYDVRAFNALIYLLFQNKVISSLEKDELTRLLQKRTESISTVSNAKMLTEIFTDEF